MIIKMMVLIPVESMKRIRKVYKATSDSLENCKIVNCIVFSITQNYLIYIIKLWLCVCVTKSTNL